MIRYFVKFMMAVAAAVFATSCTQEIDAVDGAEVIMLPDVQNRQVLLLPTVEDTVINVKTTGWCNAKITYPASSVEADWLQMDPTDGSGRGTYGISFIFGTNENTKTRSAQVTIQSEADPNLSLTFDIMQLGQEPYIVPSTKSMTISMISIPALLNVTTNKTCSIGVRYDIGGSGWLTVTPGDNIVLGDNQLSMLATRNETGDIRTAYVVFTDVENPEFKDSVKVTQKGTFQETVFDMAKCKNGDALECSWLGDEACTSYQVIVKDKADPSIVYLDKSGLSAEDKKVNLMDYTEISGLTVDHEIEVEIIGRSETDPTFGAATETKWVTHTCFGDNSGDGASEGTAINISSARHLQNIAIVEGALDKYYQQTGDIDFSIWLTSHNYQPVGTDKSGIVPFTGVYNGNNKKIRNWAYSSNAATNGSSGIFGTISNTAKVSDIVIEKSTLSISKADGWSSKTANPNVGHAIVVGYNQGGEVSNVTLNECTVNTYTRALTGGVVGVNHGGKVAYCEVTDCTILQPNGGNKTDDSGCAVGGVVGLNWPNSTVSYCKISGGSIENRSQNQPEGPAYTGGIVGASDGLVEQCYNLGTTPITGGSGTNSMFGGIVGGSIAYASEILNWSNGSPRFEDMAGYRTKTGIIRQCANASAIYVKATAYAGGIVGSYGNSGGTVTDFDNVKVEECYNVGPVISSNPGNGNVYCGGIVGRAYFLAVANCHYGASVPGYLGYIGPKGKQIIVAGGIIGNASQNVSVTNCYAGGFPKDATKPFIDAIFEEPWSTGNYGEYNGAIIGCVEEASNTSDTKIVGCHANIGITSSENKETKDVDGKTVYYASGYLFNILKNADAAIFVSSDSEMHENADMFKSSTYSGWDPAIWTFTANRRPALTNVELVQRPSDSENGGE